MIVVNSHGGHVGIYSEPLRDGIGEGEGTIEGPAVLVRIPKGDRHVHEYGHVGGVEGHCGSH